MVTITIPKEEYTKLKRQSSAYRRFASRVFEDAILDPVKDAVKDFKEMGIYSNEFLADLERGLRKSSYGKQNGDRSAQK